MVANRDHLSRLKPIEAEVFMHFLMRVGPIAVQTPHPPGTLFEDLSAAVRRPQWFVRELLERAAKRLAFNNLGELKKSTVACMTALVQHHDLGQRLVEGRQAYGHSQEEAADHMVIAVRALKDIETGKTKKPHPSTVRKIERYIENAPKPH